MGSFLAENIVKKGIVRMRVWVWFVPKYPRGLVLCLKDALCQTLTVKKFTQKKKKKFNVSIIEKFVAPFL